MTSSKTGKNRKAFILFPDTWLSYSPSIINLAKVMIDNGWQVSVQAFDDGSYRRTGEIEVSYTVPNRATRKIVGIFKLFSLYRFLALSARVFRLRKEGFDVVIGVDSLGYLIARLFFDKPVYYSLELRNNLSTFLCKTLGIDRIIIQTRERLDQTFRDCSYRPADVWFIQNSPILERGRQNLVKRDHRGFRMVYFGNVAKNTYGIENCINVLHHVADDISLTLKGPVTTEYRKELENSYGGFISSGRLSFDSEYVLQDAVISWLEEFDLGFCFYDEGQILRGNPDILSAPSGKLFNYFAAGLPVIGSKISGLRILTEFGAGILLERQQPETIGAAVTEIRQSYEKYKQGSRQAALVNDFRVMAESFLADLAKPAKAS